MSLSLAISSWFAGRVDVGNVVELISVVITPVEPETIVDESCCILRSGILFGSKKRKNRCNNALRKESLVDFAHEREKMESS
jgi:hypothetical protein